MKFFNFKKEEKPYRELIIDIRSASVLVAIVNTAKEKPEIEFVSKNFLYALTPSGENVERFISQMISLVDKTLEQVITTGLQKLSTNKEKIKIEKILVVYGSPWHKIFTKDIKIKEEKPFIFTKNKFNELIQKQIKIEEQENNGEQVIEKDVTHVILNGYELTNPFNKETNELTFSFYVSLINKKIIEIIEDKIKKHFNHTKITHRTFPLIFFDSMRNVFLNANTFCYFDISGEITDFGIIENGSFVFTGSIPIGKNHFIRKVSEICKIENSAVNSMLSLLAKGEVDKTCIGNVPLALELIEKDWINSIKRIIEEENDGKIAIPQKVFITVDDEGIEMFSNLLNKSYSKRNLFETEEEIQIIALKERYFQNFVKVNNEQNPNSHILLESIFLNNR